MPAMCRERDARAVPEGPHGREGGAGERELRIHLWSDVGRGAVAAPRMMRAQKRPSSRPWLKSGTPCWLANLARTEEPSWRPPHGDPCKETSRWLAASQIRRSQKGETCTDGSDQ